MVSRTVSPKAEYLPSMCDTLQDGDKEYDLSIL